MGFHLTFWSPVTPDPSKCKGSDPTRGLVKVRLPPFLFSKQSPRLKTSGKIRGNRLVKIAKNSRLPPFLFSKQSPRLKTSGKIRGEQIGKDRKKSNKTKLRSKIMKLCPDSKIPTLVHILHISCTQNYSTNYSREGRTISFRLSASFFARGATIFSIASSSSSS